MFAKTIEVECERQLFFRISISTDRVICVPFCTCRKVGKCHAGKTCVSKRNALMISVLPFTNHFMARQLLHARHEVSGWQLS